MRLQSGHILVEHHHQQHQHQPPRRRRCLAVAMRSVRCGGRCHVIDKKIIIIIVIICICMRACASCDKHVHAQPYSLCWVLSDVRPPHTGINMFIRCARERHTKKVCAACDIAGMKYRGNICYRNEPTGWNARTHFVHVKVKSAFRGQKKTKYGGYLCTTLYNLQIYNNHILRFQLHSITLERCFVTLIPHFVLETLNDKTLSLVTIQKIIFQWSQICMTCEYNRPQPSTRKTLPFPKSVHPHIIPIPFVWHYTSSHRIRKCLPKDPHSCETAHKPGRTWDARIHIRFEHTNSLLSVANTNVINKKPIDGIGPFAQV